MIIASQKKKENIAEYLLYMWQVEALIRACNLDLDKIEERIIAAFDQPESVKKEMRAWYESLIDMMRREGVAEKGHLQLNKNIIIALTDLHLRLMAAAKEPFYAAAYYKALPYIVELRAKAGETPEGEIETCFSALYGMMLLRMQNKPISPQTAEAMQHITHFIALLAKKYKEEQEAEATAETFK